MNSIKTEKTLFGQTSSGKEIWLFTLSNKNGMKASITNYGVTLTHLIVPDRNGKDTDVVLGFDTFEGYQSEGYMKAYSYMGATVGRVCNRIDGGKFKLRGENYEVDNSKGGHHLHGGKEGFDKKIWTAEEIPSGVKFSYLSPDGEENYPGNLKVEVTFTLGDDNRLLISYAAETDKATVVNLTNHSYFNLSGDFSKTILEHDLKVNAPFYVSVREGSIPTGEILSVKNTPFDFLKTRKVKEGVFSDHPQTLIGNGLDQTVVFDKEQPSLELSEQGSGIKLELESSEPGIQLYTANYFDGTVKGKGVYYPQYGGIALETQHFPDSPNHAHFPSVELQPGEKFASYTSLKFSVIK
ncbi:galactose mutarotase [Echinicola marina]|uniref:aldose epimerase family protein n=1 Tax=Echinicola marina TaxID=2859768 RepID=UPI001CF62931|nr:aldose epimerase family protein [Echinicola marina]UCS94165.1 galactose mutarotase [Echinicola marina]